MMSAGGRWDFETLQSYVDVARHGNITRACFVIQLSVSPMYFNPVQSVVME